MHQQVGESQQLSGTNNSSMEFSLTADQFLYIQSRLPKGYALVDVKKKKEKKDTIQGDVESQSQSVQAARNSVRRAQPKQNNYKKIESKKHIEDEPVVKIKPPPTPVISLSPEQTSYYQSILSQIKKHKSAFPFLKPVDPIELEIPDYFEVIKHPMDLSTIQKKLKQKQYQTAAQFLHDLNQIWVNSYSYNPKGSDMYMMTTQMEKFSNKLLVKPQVAAKEKQIVISPPQIIKKITQTKQPQKSSKKSKTQIKEAVKVMTEAQKKQLKFDIEQLPSQYLSGVWEIVAKDREDVETIVDLNSLEFEKLKKLDAYCKDIIHFKKKEEKKVVETTIDVHELVSAENSSFILDSD